MSILMQCLACGRYDNRGHPLTDRSQARTLSRPPFLLAGFSLHFILPCCFRSNPFPRCWLRPNRACHPYGSSGVRCTAPALAEPRPRETLVPPQRPDKDHRSVARVSASSPQLAHPAERGCCRFSGSTTTACPLRVDDPVIQQHNNNSGGDDRPPLRPPGSRPVPMSGWPAVTKLSDETAFHIERLSPLQHVVARPHQLVRQRLGRHHGVRFGFLALEETPCFLAVAAREVRRIDERPHQIGVAAPARGTPDS